MAVAVPILLFSLLGALYTCITWPLIREVGLLFVEERRDRLGQCVACGYDLTGNVSGTCSECGSAIAVRRS